jgi:hypothetical protein
MFLALPFNAAHPVYADNWAIGTYYTYCVCGGPGNSDWGAYFVNNGMPAPATLEQTFAVFTATTNSLVPQVAIMNAYSGPGLLDSLSFLSGGADGNFGCSTCHGTSFHPLSGLLGSWHTIELKLTSVVSGNTNNEYINWLLDGVIYDTYIDFSCQMPCAVQPFSTEMVPSMAVESYDNTNTDLVSLDVHGWFQYTIGTNTGSMYLYPAQWGACPPVVSQQCPNGVGGSCPVPSTAQTTTSYIGRDVQAPGNGAVTGNTYSSGAFGTTYEWGIGNYNGLSEITDSMLSSSFCSPTPPLVA